MNTSSTWLLAAEASSSYTACIHHTPDEVILIICECLPQADIASLRLTSRRYGGIGAREMYRSLNVIFTLKSFANILKIARHPILRKWVQNIVYNALFVWKVQDGWDKVEYVDRVAEELGRRSDLLLEATRGTPDQVLETADERKERIRVASLVAWDVQQGFQEAQNKMQRENYDIVCFKEIFSSFTNLKEFTLDTQFWRFRDVDKAWEGAYVLNRVNGSDSPERDEYTKMNSLVATIPLPCGIRSLTVQAIDMAMFGLPPDSPALATKIYSRLRYLRIELDKLEEMTEGLDHIRLQQELGKIVRSATALECLELVFDPAHNWRPEDHNYDLHNARGGYEPVELQNIMANRTWPRLHTLSITSVTTTRLEIFDILRRHASTLKHLKLTRLWLTEEDPSNVVEDINSEDDASNSTGGTENVSKNKTQNDIVLFLETELKLRSLNLEALWGLESDTGEIRKQTMDWDSGDQARA